VTEFREFWTRDESKELTEPTELKESKDLTKSEKRTEPKNLIEPIEHTTLNPHPYASPLSNTDPHPPHSSSHTHTQMETFTFTNMVSYRICSTEPSENDMHIQFCHGVKSDTPSILKQHTYHRTAGPSNTHPMKTSPAS
jgi:hypothetical protein